jgi:hypothetical protein
VWAQLPDLPSESPTEDGSHNIIDRPEIPVYERLRVLAGDLQNARADIPQGFAARTDAELPGRHLGRGAMERPDNLVEVGEEEIPSLLAHTEQRHLIPVSEHAHGRESGQGISPLVMMEELRGKVLARTGKLFPDGIPSQESACFKDAFQPHSSLHQLSWFFSLSS